jgi:ketol-acid reductoisomerase
MRTYREADMDLALVRDRRVAIMGFGAQGRAHALNLRDSGVDVVVGLREGSTSRAACDELGLSVAAPGEAATGADIVAMLVPDEVQPDLYRETLATTMREGSAMLFAHGYNIHYGHIRPRADLDVLMVAPLGNGHGRAGVFESTFKDETETDLFAEQAVLCGGLTHLIETAYETLVEAGYPEELAYFGCLHEVKLIADLIHSRGIAGMRKSISSTAAYGDYSRGPRVINRRSREAMREMLEEIRDGRFDRELSGQAGQGFPAVREGRQRSGEHSIETVGRRLRAMMPWLEGE